MPRIRTLQRALFLGIFLGTGTFVLSGVGCASNVTDLFPRSFVLLSRDVTDGRQILKGTMFVVPYEGVPSGPAASVVVSGSADCAGAADADACRRRAVIDGLRSLFDPDRGTSGMVSSITAVENGTIDAERVNVDRCILVHQGIEVVSEEATEGEYRIVLRVVTSSVDVPVSFEGDPIGFDTGGSDPAGMVGRPGGATARNVHKAMSHMGRRFRDMVQALGRVCAP